MNADAHIQEELLLAADLISCISEWRKKQVQTCQAVLSDIIQQLADIKCARKHFVTQYIPELIGQWERIKADLKIKNCLTGNQFNPLSFIRIGETTHSQLLGNLLNPHGTHGQDNLFLKSFLKRLKVPDPAEGRWTTHIESSGRIDILLQRAHPASVIIIENKSNNAPDQRNQLYRYWYQAIHKPYPELDYSNEDVRKSFQVIYLPPGDQKSPPDHAARRPDSGVASELDLPEEMPLKPEKWSFDTKVADWLRECMEKIPSKNFRLRAFIEFYIENITL